jgi:hypothetical protein
MLRFLIAAALALALSAGVAEARGHFGHASRVGSYYHAESHFAHRSYAHHGYSPSYWHPHGTSFARDHHGHIKRSRAARDAFERSHPCPATGRNHGACPGYVVDHVIALKHGGADAPSNMQWQTKAAAKAKDKWE